MTYGCSFMKKAFLVLTIILTILLKSCNHTRDYNINIINPTCTKEGYTQYTCKCNDTYKDNYTKKLDHSYMENINLVLPGGVIHKYGKVEFVQMAEIETVSVLSHV